MQRIIWGAGWFSISIPSNTMRADVKRFIHSWMQCYFGLLHDDPIENQILHSCKTLNNSWTMQLHPKLAALLGNSKVYIPVEKGFPCWMFAKYSRVSDNSTSSSKGTLWKIPFHMACKELTLDVAFSQSKEIANIRWELWWIKGRLSYF